MWEKAVDCYHTYREWFTSWTGLTAGSMLSISILFLYAGQSAMYYRPVPDYVAGGRAPGLTRLRELDATRAPMGLFIMRWLVQMVTVSAMKLVIGCRNTIEIADAGNYRQTLSLIRSRPPGVPLLTVANHVSSMDDPGLISCLLPYDIVMQPNKMRWGVATQEIVFPKVPWINAFMGAGNVLPICRGGGIDQGLFMDFARVVAAGGWAHIFPEGRVVQTAQLARDPITKRSEREEKEKGRLKWGVGKLIAHAPVPPVVVPFYHLGMASVLPQHNVWSEDGKEFRNGVVSWQNIRAGNRVKVWFGHPVEGFAELIAKHEQRHGPLWKMDTAPTEPRWDSLMKQWESSRAEKELYSALTRQVEAALLKLERKAKLELVGNNQTDFQAACPRALAALPPGIAKRAP
mmetsp:Transcript_24374/g.58048  ORF Transcript_24374/g.58048 Transcript_24374/m.58048 type:complete len:403 (+) Transcript_24374:205-1413(+)